MCVAVCDSRSGGDSKAYIDGKIDLSPSGECSWTKINNSPNGYIEKKQASQTHRRRDQIAHARSSLTSGQNSPTALTNLVQEVSGGVRRAKWNPTGDPDIGSWEIGFRVFANGKLIGTADGTPFVLSPDADSRLQLEVRSVNANGNQRFPGCSVYNGTFMRDCCDTHSAGLRITRRLTAIRITKHNWFGEANYFTPTM
ncbi:MAG: hypothetical protein VXZ82_12010 [Planctomycetota bacterium]|nr:hypothetical protein [Planctomycetota bacterium]